MAKQTRLAAFHQRHSVVFAEHEGWLLPEHFGATDREYAAVRNNVGLIDFSHRAMLQFTGPDRLSFLQGMLSNDLRPLKMFEGQLAAILTQQGKLIADVRVLCAMSSFYLDFWEPLKEKIIHHLNRYLVADEVEIVDPNEQWATLSIQGPQSEALLNEVLAQSDLPRHAHGHAMIQFNQSPICVVRAHRFGELGFDIIVKTSELQQFAERLTETGSKFQAKWVGEQAQNILRVETGVPRSSVDMSEDNLLLETGLDNSVSFTKGCYLGQEVVERIRSRGHVNKKLCGLVFDGKEIPASGAAVTAEGKEVGKITSAVLSPALGCAIGLAMLHKDHWNPGTQVSVSHESAVVSARVTSLPFVQSRSP